MKRSVCSLILSLTFTNVLAGKVQTTDIPNIEVIKEKAGFALGLNAKNIEISDIRQGDDNITVKFNTHAQGRIFQCYFTAFQKVTSDAICSPTDGNPLPKSAACNGLTHASGQC